MQQSPKGMTRFQKVMIGSGLVVVTIFVVPLTLGLGTMWFTAFQADVGCRNHPIEHDESMEAQASELRSVQLQSGNEGTWSQEYRGRNCGNMSQHFVAERTVDVSGRADNVLSALRTQLSQQGYYLTDEKYTGIAANSCVGKYLATLPLKNGGNATLALKGAMTPPPLAPNTVG